MREAIQVSGGWGQHLEEKQSPQMLKDFLVLCCEEQWGGVEAQRCRNRAEGGPGSPAEQPQVTRVWQGLAQWSDVTKSNFKP